MQLLFATNNLHKLGEVREMLNDNYNLVGLSEIGIQDEIPETHDTLEDNALEKVNYIYNKYHLSCFADDTGLEVDFLDGRPGVYSARYAGVGCTFEENVDKLLYELKGSINRKARFRTIIALLEDNEKINLFEGIVEGHISEYRLGDKGFGYDPVFIPDGFSQSFAEMTLSLKNTISHRAKAFQNLVSFLNAAKM